MLYFSVLVAKIAIESFYTHNANAYELNIGWVPLC